jgi:CRP/FNR family transcriptional regulator, nitrogen oxide reductase regulator
MIETQSITDALHQCALTHNLTAEAQTAVVAAAHLRRVTAGEFFFHQGEESRTMYVLLQGQVKLTQVTEAGAQLIIGYYGPGEGLGIIVALARMAYPLSVEATEDSQALGWTREAMAGLMRQYSQLALNGMAMIGGRYVQLQERFQDMATRRVEQRVARTLLRLVRQFGRRVEQGVLIDIPLSRQDLAEMAGTNLYSVSRMMSQWERDGILLSDKQQVILVRAHQLVVLGEDL